jgi:hypothetical protein
MNVALRYSLCPMLKKLVLFMLLSSLSAQTEKNARPSIEINDLSTATRIGTAKAELEAMFEADQAHRIQVIDLERQHGRDSAEVKAAWAKQSLIDAQNIRRLEEIIGEFGWPGSTQFGSWAATAAFLILQHSDLRFQKKYLPLARAAAKKGEMKSSDLALLEDRIRLRDGMNQIYGSQVTRNAADEWEPLPLEDEEKVDSLRASVGLGRISEYLEGFAKRSGGRVNPKWKKEEIQPKQAPPTPPNITQTPLVALTTREGVAFERRRDLAVSELKGLLSSVVVTLVVAEVGKPLQWVVEGEKFQFWKHEVQPHLAEEGKSELNAYPGGYFYVASEWRSDAASNVVVLLEKHR